MYAQNPMFSGVSPGRMAEARRFAQGGQMGRAKQQFELGGGTWNPQVHRMIGQGEDAFNPSIPQDGSGGSGNINMPTVPPQWGGGPGGPGMHTNWPTLGGDIFEANPGMGGRPGWGFGGGQGGMNRPVKAVMPYPGMPNGVAGYPSYDPGMFNPGGGMGGGLGGGMGRLPMPPPQFQGRPPAGGGFGNQLGPWSPQGGMGGRPPAGPPGLRRRVMY